MSGTSGNVVHIRGTRVVFDDASIYAALGMTPPPDCVYARLALQTTVEEDDDIAVTLTIPGFGWTMDHRRAIIRSGHLTTAANLWFQFLRHNLMPTLHDGTLSYDKCILLYCILRDHPINLGPIIRSAFREALGRLNARLIFPSLITRLLKHFEVPVDDEDETETHTSCIDQGTIDRMKRSFRFSERSAAQVPLSHGASSSRSWSRATSSQPQVPDAVYGTETWLTILTGQLEEQTVAIRGLQETLATAVSYLSVVDERSQRTASRLAEYWTYAQARDSLLMHHHLDPVLAARFPPFPNILVPTTGTPTEAAASVPPPPNVDADHSGQPPPA
ncbi:hypothetical protein L6452_13933 [Arctium lappa]|uniref:Uncharacterized protein n=1 Tax=Arctium lappa TaxID=4217 RepID=A0ACB9CJN1_ARCLA|nr:hypothetical protein L6452_13933 [Arctium lappa]